MIDLQRSIDINQHMINDYEKAIAQNKKEIERYEREKNLLIVTNTALMACASLPEIISKKMIEYQFGWCIKNFASYDCKRSYTYSQDVYKAFYYELSDKKNKVLYCPLFADTPLKKHSIEANAKNNLAAGPYSKYHLDFFDDKELEEREKPE